MLTLQDRPTFTMPITVNTVAVQGSLTATFIALPISQIRELEQKVNAPEGGGQAAFVKVVCKGIGDLSLPRIRLPDSGSEVGALEALLDWPGFTPAMFSAYYKGMFEEQEKNSPPPPSGS